MEVADPSADLADDQRAAILARQDDIRNGTFHPFAGPIIDNAGAEVVASGASLDIGGIKGMNFLAAGIDTTLPN